MFVDLNITLSKNREVLEKSSSLVERLMMTEPKANDALNSMTAQITEITNTYNLYKTAKTNQATTMTQNQALNASISDMDLVLRELGREEETLNKQFMDARKTVAPTGILARAGLSTMQDWSLAAFFFTFGLFLLVVTAFLASASMYWIRVVVFGLVLTAILLGGSALLIRILG